MTSHPKVAKKRLQGWGERSLSTPLTIVGSQQSLIFSADKIIKVTRVGASEICQKFPGQTTFGSTKKVSPESFEMMDSTRRVKWENAMIP